MGVHVQLSETEPKSPVAIEFARRASHALHAAIATFLWLAATPARAQSELAGVYGRVTDASGAVIADAEVEITNLEGRISPSP